MSFPIGSYVRHSAYGVSRVTAANGTGYYVAPLHTVKQNAMLAHESELSACGRYFVKTGYHYWQIIDRDSGYAVDSVSAKGRGDVAARELARERCDALNAQHDAMVAS